MILKQKRIEGHIYARVKNPLSVTWEKVDDTASRSCSLLFKSLNDSAICVLYGHHPGLDEI